MASQSIPAPRILADGRPVAGVGTEIGRLGGYDLTIATTVGDLALDVQTTVLGHPATATLVSWIVRSRELAESGSEQLPPGGLADQTAVSRRLLEHYVHVQAAITEITGAEVTIDLEDHALRAALSGSPHAG